jgi:hypothetical protein
MPNNACSILVSDVQTRLGEKVCAMGYGSVCVCDGVMVCVRVFVCVAEKSCRVVQTASSSRLRTRMETINFGVVLESK